MCGRVIQNAQSLNSANPTCKQYNVSTIIVLCGPKAEYNMYFTIYFDCSTYLKTGYVQISLPEHIEVGDCSIRKKGI